MRRMGGPVLMSAKSSFIALSAESLGACWSRMTKRSFTKRVEWKFR